MKRSFAETHVDTVRLEELLRKTHPGDLISYAAISETARRPLEKCRGILRTARNAMLREGIAFDCVPSVGLRHLEDVATVEAGGRFVVQAGRKAATALRYEGAVKDFGALPNDSKIRHNVAMAQAGIIRQESSRRTSKRIAERLGAKAFSVAEAIEQLKGIV